jgi:2-polyprenyl-6-methoxyphenol hydroxylase-like FAD-dependent oxidoreductase
MDVDVVVAGGGPAGLLLASELRLGSADPVVLERLAAPTGLSKALGLVGRVVQTLDQRGLLERFGAGFVPVAAYSRFAHLGGIALEATPLIESAPPGYHPAPMPARQAKVEELLEGRARELGADIRRGHELVGFTQDEQSVTVEVRGPHGTYRLSTRTRCRQEVAASFSAVVQPASVRARAALTACPAPILALNRMEATSSRNRTEGVALATSMPSSSA